MERAETLAPFGEERTRELLGRFHADGFLHIPGVFGADEVAALRAGIDEAFANPRWKGNLYGDFIAVRLFEIAPIFEQVLAREPIIGLVERILGADCHLIAQNAVRNAPGQAIDAWHVDETLYFPLGAGMVRHDPRLQMPVFVCTVQCPLTDIPSVEYGPSEYVPGSQYSGRGPGEPPVFEGRGPVQVLCRAGDIYLHNPQTWHRGMPNRSDRTRYLFQLSYGRRWIAQRFHPFITYRLPEGILDRGDERRRRVLGAHPKGPYG